MNVVRVADWLQKLPLDPSPDSQPRLAHY